MELYWLDHFWQDEIIEGHSLVLLYEREGPDFKHDKPVIKFFLRLIQNSIFHHS